MEILNSTLLFGISLLSYSLISIVEIYMKNYNILINNRFSIISFLCVIAIPVLIIFATISKPKSKFNSIFPLVAMVVFTSSSAIKTHIIVYSEKFNELNSFANFCKSMKDWQLIIFTVLMSAGITYLTTLFVNYLCFVIYAIILITFYTIFSDKINMISSDIPSELRFLGVNMNHPIIGIIIFFVIFLFIRNFLISFLYTLIGCLLILAICDITFKSPKGFYNFFKSLCHKETPENMSHVLTWGGLVLLIYGVRMLIKQNMFKKQFNK